MASETEICNLALSHVGVSKEIASLETENSQEANACRRFYTQARDKMLRTFPWPFATRIISLGLIESDPNDEWDFSYRYPSDAMFIRRILSGMRNDTRQSRVPHKIANDGTARLIYTDQQTAQAEYTQRATDTSLFPPDFVEALSLLLAALIAPRVTGGDPFKMSERSIQLFVISNTNAQSGSVNEEQVDEPPESEFARAHN